MSQRARLALLPAATAAAVLAIASWQLPAHGQGQGMPPAEAQALWQHLQGYQQQYKLFPGKDKLYQGSDPHGALLTTYVNDTAHQALTQGKAGVMPAGSILVKENYSPNRELMAVTVMYKVSGYNPPANDWFWLKRTADGKVEAAGKVEACISCHSGGKERDYVLTPVKR